MIKIIDTQSCFSIKPVYISLILLVSVLLSFRVTAQPPKENDTIAIMKLVDKANQLRFQKPDSFLTFAKSVELQARQMGYKKAIAALLNTIGEFQRVSGHYPEALEKFAEAGAVAEQAGETFILGQSIGFKGITYIALGEYPKAIQNLRQAYLITRESPGAQVPAFFLSNLGDAYDKMGKGDSAMYYQLLAWEFARRSTMRPGQAYVLGKLGVLHGKLRNIDSAFYYFNRGLETGSADVLNKGRIYFYMADFFTNLGKEDSARKYGRLAVVAGYVSNQRNIVMDAADLLYKNYMVKGNRDSALYFLQINSRLKDSLFSPERFRKMQILAINEQENKFLAEKEQHELKSQLEKGQIRTRSRYRTIAFSVTILFVGLLALFVWRNLKRQKRVNLTLREQQEKISAQNIELEKALKELKATQSQLIQSEKMASLGELTAGIAHEIQNPLNFVNNFSEVNTELIDELQELLTRDSYRDGNWQQAKEVSERIKLNEEKIIIHGKRADAIVKSMLQHSRTSSGKKEPTDINALTDEFLRLAYHGLRAKDKTFNANYDIELDPGIGKLTIASQEIGRVLLNLFNNAFYAVTEKKRNTTDNSYHPTVSVQTKKEKDKVSIVVKDNGDGVSKPILDKIFQPFFTTKPTGQGTGLGLSLSYDIVKAHGGALRIETIEGEGTKFILELPIN